MAEQVSTTKQAEASSKTARMVSGSAAQIPPYAEAQLSYSRSQMEMLYSAPDFQNVIRHMEMYGRIETILSRKRECEKVERSGWLPHSSTPFELLSNLPDDELSMTFENYYRENWPSISRSFEAGLLELDIDSEAKETFREALLTHANGYYRSTCRVLFPEIERLDRDELTQSAQRTVSLHEFRQQVGQLSRGTTHVDTETAYSFYKKLHGHIYERCKTPEEIARITSDPVPNRHAAIHGTVIYKSFQNSMNALILADHAFRLVCAIKSSRTLGSFPA